MFVIHVSYPRRTFSLADALCPPLMEAHTTGRHLETE
jgi:hypothetical protein